MSNITKADVFKKGLLTGSMVGEATYIVPSLVFVPPLQENPYLNRVIDTGTYNVLQDVLFSRFDMSWNRTVDNPVYLGLLQTSKFVTGRLVQNDLAENLGHAPKTPWEVFAITGTGLVYFFSVAEIESSIISESNKWAFTATYTSALAGYHYLAGMATEITKAGAINLSFGGFAMTTLGLISSFAIINILHEIGVDKGEIFEIDQASILKAAIVGSAVVASAGNPVIAMLSVGAADKIINDESFEALKQAEIFGYKLSNVLSLASFTAAEIYKDGNYAMAFANIAARSIAKALAISGVSEVYDLKDTLCDYSLFESACEYLGW